MPEFDQRTSDETPVRFAVMVERDAHGMRVGVVGALDIASAPELDRVLDGLAGKGDLLLDLDRVVFMDSSGLAALLRANRTAERYGQQLTVRYSTSAIRRLFELTGVIDQFPGDHQNGDLGA